MRRVEASKKNTYLHRRNILAYNHVERDIIVREGGGSLMAENIEEQHPVPRQISGYEFRLIGDMTLKQFGELAAGEIMALICWSLPITPLLKYPLVGFFAFLGIALAFIPVHEQPMDRWIMNFIKATYSPTQFIWKKSEVQLDILERATVQKLPEMPTPPPKNGKKLKEYLKTVPIASGPSPLEKDLDKKLRTISSLFEEAPGPDIFTLPQIKRKPHKTVKPKFEPKLPMPSRPSVPNVLVGMALDQTGKIIPDVIIEIRDKAGFPVRALKANKLGQFRIATPLKNGTYELELEKEGHQFDIIKFEAQGEIIEPMEIRAKEPAHAN
jgi:hypothetical protein